MIKLYGPRMGSAMRSHWVLAEVGAEYEDVAIDMRQGDHKKPDFLEMNPNGQVPVMVDSDFVLYESIAICNYVAEKYMPVLLGSTPEEKALVLQWSLWSSFNIQKHFGTMFGQKLSGTNDETILHDAKTHVERYLAILDKSLEGKEYLVGDQFTLAEINVTVAVSYAHFVDYDYSAYPNITRWMKMVMDRPAFLKSAAQENK